MGKQKTCSHRTANDARTEVDEVRRAVHHDDRCRTRPIRIGSGGSRPQHHDPGPRDRVWPVSQLIRIRERHVLLLRTASQMNSLAADLGYLDHALPFRGGCFEPGCGFCPTASNGVELLDAKPCLNVGGFHRPYNALLEHRATLRWRLC